MKNRTTLTPVSHSPTRCTQCPVRERALYQAVDDEYVHSAQSKRLNQYRLRAKKMLYAEGDQPDMAFTLFSGWLLLYRSNMDGERQGLRIALPGDFVGFLPDTRVISRMNHAAVAITDSTLCGFRQDDLRTMLKDHPGLSIQLNAFQSRDIASCQNTVLGIGRKSAEQRIAFLLLELYDRLKNRTSVDEATGTMPFMLTQSMLGDLTGLTPVHTNRILRRLSKDGVIKCEKQTIQILARDQLVEIGEYQFSGVPGQQ